MQNNYNKYHCCKLFGFILLQLIGLSANSQDAVPYPNHYICYKAKSPIHIDGKLSEKSWKKTAWAGGFTSLADGTQPIKGNRTQFKMLWDDDFLYLAASLEEDHIVADFTERESMLYLENVFEFFLDPDGDNFNYIELEINARNTIWDLKMDKPYRDGGQADSGWNIDSLQTAVRICGSLNKANNKDKKWLIEIAFPWASLTPFTLYKQKPWSGALWRMNFLRMDWAYSVANNKYVKKKDISGKDIPPIFWAWQSVDKFDIHQPEQWGFLQFSNAVSGQSKTSVIKEPDYDLKQALMEIYALQQKHFRQYKKYASELSSLKLRPVYQEKFGHQIKLTPTRDGYIAKINGLKAIYTIHHSGWLERQDYL